MKLTDIINYPFPDNEGYRITDIQKVERKNDTYMLLLTFQKLENARTRYNSSNFKEKNTLRKFQSGRTILRVGNIAYARLFIIGSIWWNEGKPLAIPPDYLSQYSFDYKFIGNNNLKLCDASYFINEHSMGMEYNDKNNQLVARYSKILCFELSTPLFHHKKKEGVFPLYGHTPPWPPIETNFIAFNSYEVYRYFFTSYGITDLNARMFFPQFNPKSPTENLLFDPTESVEKDGKHFVHLLKPYDFQDTSILGNIAYYSSFKGIIRKIQNHLNKFSSFDFRYLEKLPVSNFKQMQVTAVRVKRKSDGAEGLYIVQIHYCKGYIDHKYTPVIPVNDSSAPKKPSPSGGRGGKSKGPKEGTEPKVNHDTTTGMGSDTVNLNLLGLEHLLTPTPDIDLDDTLHKLVNPDGTFLLLPSDENGRPIFPPGPYPDGKGPRPKNNINVERTNYFEFFPEIVELISAKIKEYRLDVNHSYLGDDYQYHSKSTIIDATKIKTLVFSEDDPLWELYLAEIKVSGPDFKVRYYYLFEKYSETHTSSRTWLYAQSDFRQFKEDDLTKSIKEFLFEQKNSSPKRTEPDNKLNHLQSKVVGTNNKGDNEYASVEKDVALNKHIQKIANRILKVYGFRLPG